MSFKYNRRSNYPPQVDFLLPVGISFYTFQALSYVIDVYRGNINAETNLFRYALYVSFFPQLVAGPIEKSADLLPQLQNITQINLWDYRRIKKGLFLMWGGYFQKLVIADRISLLVNTVYDNYNAYGLVEIGLATILFAFQIYCDFNGYSEIARGASQIMGIELSHNFRQPYLAKNIKDFWSRWHISLTSWFTSYLYIPLGGNRRGLLRKYINILIVFTISGLWHGAQWNFVIWGFLHGIYSIASNIKTHFTKKPKQSSLSKRLRQTIFTFFLVDFAWLFFASASFKDALMMLRQALSCVYTSNIFELGLDKINWIILITALVCIYIADLFHEYNKSILEFIEKQEWWFRWSFYVSIVWIIIIFGVYGTQYDTSQFIYFQF